MTIHCENVRFEYAAPDGAVLALQDITFSVADGEFVCIVGPSGCGKTTLLKLIAGLMRPGGGEIRFEGTPDEGLLPSAMVFQEHGLYPWMSVLDNVTLGLRFKGEQRSDREEHAMTLIRQFGLSAFAHRYPHELSVGMRQRVSLARAFVMKPGVLLMDEPFASLDALTKVVLQEELLRIWKLHRNQVVYITHDIDEALLLGDRVLVMSGRPGVICDDITVPLSRPRTRDDLHLAELIDCKTRIWKSLEAEVRKMVGANA